MNRSMKKSMDLCMEYCIFSFRNRDMKGMEFKEWVYFMWYIEVRKFFIFINIYCMNNYWFIIYFFKNSFVCFILFIFSWEVLRIYV